MAGRKRHSAEDIVRERSITGEHLVAELKAAFAAAGGPPKVLRMDNGPEMVSLSWSLSKAMDQAVDAAIGEAEDQRKAIGQADAHRRKQLERD
ncbi:MAG: hypothetical protein VYA67_15100 [Actinomycetota bacterium]|nr:hypothetical protein [Actinomycetota bacterium]